MLQAKLAKKSYDFPKTKQLQMKLWRHTTVLNAWTL